MTPEVFASLPTQDRGREEGEDEAQDVSLRSFGRPMPWSRVLHSPLRESIDSPRSFGFMAQSGNVAHSFCSAACPLTCAAANLGISIEFLHMSTVLIFIEPRNSYLTFDLSDLCLERLYVLCNGTWADHALSSKWAAKLRCLGLL